LEQGLGEEGPWAGQWPLKHPLEQDPREVERKLKARSPGEYETAGA
jgi:hypothetical protein